MLSEFIQPAWFFGALAVGILIALWYKPEMTVVVKHPTPYNVHNTTFQDNTGSCYRYNAAKVTCPATGAHKYKLV